MKLDATTVPIEPRSLGACIDLAVQFQRRHARPLLQLTLLFLVPATLLTVLVVAAAPDTGLLWSAAVYFVAAPWLGAALVAGAGRAVFGEPFAARAALRALTPRGAASLLVVRVFVALATLLCFGLGGAAIDAYYGFLPEVLVLEQLEGSEARRRVGELVGPTYLVLLWRRTALVVFGMIVAAAVYDVADELLGLLAGRPLFTGRIDPRFWSDDLALLWADPWAAALLSAAAWLVYPLTRLAWFFCYLDTRIRREGWDLELGFRVEARRLAATA